MRPDPGIPDTSALGALLAGGAGERLALGVPKAHARLAGRTLFEQALAALGGACGRVWVAAPGSMTLPAVSAGVASFTRVNDPDDAGGPLAGLTAVARDAAFARAAGETGARIVTLAVDLPLVSSHTLRTLLASFDALGGGTGAVAALVPAPGGRPQPLAAVWSKTAFEALAAAFECGERSVTRACAPLGIAALDDAALARLGVLDDVTRDIDTAADLAELERPLDHPEREEA